MKTTNNKKQTTNKYQKTISNYRYLFRLLFGSLELFVFCCLIFVVLCNNSAFAAIIGTTDDPMMVGGGARPLGMGRAFTAVAEDADAPFINPAGIATMKGPSVMAMFTNLMGDVYYSEFCGEVPTNFGTVGMGYITTGVNQIPVTGGTYTDYYDSLFLVSYSSPIGRFTRYANNVFVGANIKFFNRGFTGGGVDQYASGMSADVGLKYIYNPYLSFGICRQNFLPVSMGGVIRISSGAEEALASITKIGVALKPVAFNKDVLIALDADIPAQSGRPFTAHFGTEWNMLKYFTVRGGLDQSVDASSASQTSWNPTFGASLDYKGFRVDYAYHPYYNDSGLATRYISLSYVGEPWFAMKGKIE